MEKGYVYVGRLVDHNDNFITNYRKLGRSCDFKTREVSLNSTHLPFDVRFDRVFETQYMNGLEKVLHACFQEYRVIKMYDWRRKITTEWFDVEDSELFDDKINAIIKNFPSTKEVDMTLEVQNDTGLTENQKVEIINTIVKNKKTTNFKLILNGEDVSEETAKLTMYKAYDYVASKVGWVSVCQTDKYVTNNIQEFYDRFTNFREYMTYQTNGYHIFTSMDNEQKWKVVKRLLKRYNISEMVCEYTKN